MTDDYSSPTSVSIPGAGWWTVVGGTNPTLLDDASDATYDQFDSVGTGDPFIYLGFEDLSFPAQAAIKLVALFSRERISAGSANRTRNWYYATDGTPWAHWETPISNTAFADYNTFPFFTDPIGRAWTPATINGFYMAITAGGSDSAPNYLLANLFLAVNYTVPPSPVITGPASPLTTTSKPTFTWTVNDADGDPQDRFRIVGRNAGGTIIYDSGVVFANVQTFTIPLALANGVYDFRLSLGDNQNPSMSAFTSPYSLTVSAPLPGTPTLAVTAYPVENRVGVSIQGTAGSLYSSYYGLERSDDGGVTWRVVQDIIASKYGVALKGAGNYLTIGDFNDFAGTASFTLEAKMAQITAGATASIVSKTTAADGYSFALSTTQIAVNRTAASVSNTLAASSVSPGVKTNLAASYDGTNQRLLKEGVLVGGPTASAVSLSNNPTAFTLGGVAGGFISNIVLFEVRVWNTRVADATILANKDANLIGTESNLVDLWEFEEGEGFTVASKVATGHTATFVGDPLWVYLANPSETFFDYTAPLGKQVLYRAFAVHDDGTVFTQSAYSTQKSATLSVTTEWIKSLVDPSLNMAIIHGGPDFDSTAKEDLTVFEPLGSHYPTIFGGTVRAKYFPKVRMITVGDHQGDQLEAIRNLQGTVLLQTCYGDDGREQHFLRLGSVLTERRLTHGQSANGLSTGMQNAQARVFEIEAYEVEPPASQGQ